LRLPPENKQIIFAIFQRALGRPARVPSDELLILMHRSFRLVAFARFKNY
jgi:hypothetical protein